MESDCIWNRKEANKGKFIAGIGGRDGSCFILAENHGSWLSGRYCTSIEARGNAGRKIRGCCPGPISSMSTGPAHTVRDTNAPVGAAGADFHGFDLERVGTRDGVTVAFNLTTAVFSIVLSPDCTSLELTNRNHDSLCCAE